MQTLILSDQDYKQIVKMAKRDYHENFQIDYRKNGCLLSIIMRHIVKWTKTVGASFKGIDEMIGECVKDVYEVIEVVCLDAEDGDVCCDFDSDRFCKILNQLNIWKISNKLSQR